VSADRSFAQGAPLATFVIRTVFSKELVSNETLTEKYGVTPIEMNEISPSTT
jgi:hypothetical protein